MIRISSFFNCRTSKSGCSWGFVRCCSETRTLFINSAYGRPASACCCALRILEAATICIALVIWAVLRMDLIRRRMSRVFAITNYVFQLCKPAMISLPGRFEFVQSCFQLWFDFLIEFLLLANGSKQRLLPRLQPILKFQLILLDAFNWHRIEVPVLHSPHHGDLLFNWNWVVLFLFKKFDNTLAPIKSRPRCRIEIRTELCKRS